MSEGNTTTLIVGPSPDLIEFARERGRAGEQFALIARTEPRLHEFRARLTGYGVSCETYVADVTDSKSVLEAFKKLIVWSPRVDRLIYNVGVVSAEPAVEVTESELARVMGTNFFGFVNCFQLCHQIFKRAHSGQAIVISSADALKHDATGVAYAASKASLQIYLAALRREVGVDIMLSELYLGEIPTEGGRRWLNCEEVVAGLGFVVDRRVERHVIGYI